MAIFSSNLHIIDIETIEKKTMIKDIGVWYSECPASWII